MVLCLLVLQISGGHRVGLGAGGLWEFKPHPVLPKIPVQSCAWGPSLMSEALAGTHGGAILYRTTRGTDGCSRTSGSQGQGKTWAHRVRGVWDIGKPELAEPCMKDLVGGLQRPCVYVWLCPSSPGDFWQVLFPLWALVPSSVK